MSIKLPKSQSVYITDKLLWELVRIYAHTKGLTIHEVVELSCKYFMQLDNKDSLVEVYKIKKGIK